MSKNGNMYEFSDHRWNPLAGDCIHNCSYCYVKALKKRFVRLHEKYSGYPRLCQSTLNQNLGRNRFYFVGSMTDMFAANVPDDMIEKVIRRANCFLHNNFLYQTKNVSRIIQFSHLMVPWISSVCFTIESDLHGEGTPIQQRIDDAMRFSKDVPAKMITIEPIMKFSSDFADKIIAMAPYQVNIGADSKRHNLPEPSKDELLKFIIKLKKYPTRISKIVLKSNLNRILS